MSLKATDVYAILNSKLKSVESGYDHAAKVTGTEDEFDLYFKDGSTIRIKCSIPEVSTTRIDNSVRTYIEDHPDEFRGQGVQIIYDDSEEILDSTVLVFDEDDFAEASSVLTDDLTATVAIGTVTVGKKYVKGTTLETVLRDMLIKEEAPKVTLTLNPNKTLYDVVSETLTNLVMTATVAKQTYDPKTVAYYVDDTLVETKNITAGGTFSYTHTFSPATNSNHTLKVVASDGKLSSNASKTIKFVGQTYYGIVDSTIGTPTDAQIKGLSKTLKDVKGYTWDGITTDFGKVVYAYPKDFGALTSIKDPVNNFTYTDSFTRTTATVDGIDYYVYTQTVASASDNVKLVFA